MKKNFLKEHFFALDYLSIFLVLALSIVGLFAVYSATYDTESIRKPIVQVIAILAGIFLMFIVSTIDYRVYKSYQKYIYIFTIIFLLFVLFFGSGREETGANSWIKLGSISFQPSEFAKIAFTLVFSFEISNAKNLGKLNNPKYLLRLLMLFLGIILPTVFQNDTGTALVFVFMFIVTLFIAGVSLKYIFAVLLVACISLPIAWLLMAPYQRDRILVFLRPEMDPLGAGYQVTQSKISIGSGGFWGRGYLNGPQNRLSLLPENETDFIFSTLGEEFGFLGCVIVFTLLILFILRIFINANKSKDWESRLILASFGAMFLFHTAENICMCIGLLPVTGIPLPFISYGGSSMVTNYIALGIILNIYKKSKKLVFYNG